MADWIAGGTVVIILGLAVNYIIRQKKSGAKCIGCPSSGSCAKCNCHKK